MLEKVLSDLLTRLLGKYVKDLNQESLRVAVWGGDLELKNLQIKAEALDSLHLPVVLRGGVIGSLSLSIPWHSFATTPLQVRVSDVSIIVAPAGERVWDEEDEKERASRKKKKKLNSLEKSKMTKRKIAAEAEAGTAVKQGGDTYTSMLVAKALESIQIYIDNIHIRYEDTRYQGMPFTCGITLQSATLTSTDEEYSSFQFEKDQRVIYKLVALENVALYWNPKEEPLQFSSDEDLARKMSKMIYRTDQPTAEGMHFMAGPICGSTKLRMHKSKIPDMDIPKVTATTLFELIKLEINELQLLQVVKVTEWIIKHQAREQLRKFRPLRTPIMEKPRVWWKFAYKSLLMKTHEKRKLWSKNHLTERRRARLEYTKLWQEFIRTKKRSPKLDILEGELPFETIAFFRSLAEAKLPASLLLGGKPSSWLSWSAWFGGDGESGVFDTADSDEDDDFTLTPAQRALFYKSIGYEGEDSKISFDDDVDPTYVKFEASLILEEVNVLLKGLEGEELQSIAEASASGFSIHAKVRPTSLTVDATLEDVQLKDHYTENSILPVLIRPLDEVVDNGKEFFRATFEKNPLNSANDFEISLRMEGIDIVIYKPWIMRLIRMLKNPFKKPTQIQRVAGQQLNTIKTMSMAQVEDIVNNHKKIGCNITACAPRIIIPEDLDQGNTTLLVIDLGDLAIQAEPRQQETKLTEADRWQDHLYDQFRIDATNLQLLLLSSEAWPLAAVSEQPKHRQLLRKFDINVSVGLLMTKASAALAKVRVSGFVPSVDFFFTGVKIRNLLRVLMAIAEDEGPPPPLPKFIQDLEEEEHEELEEGVALLLVDDFSDSHPNKVDESLVESKIVECHFSIAGGTIELERDLPRKGGAPLELGEGPTAPLALVSVEGLVVQYVLRKADMVAYVGVHAISIEDLMQEDGEEFRWLATSRLLESQTGHPRRLAEEDEEDLIKIAYEMVKLKSPHYVGLDNQVDLMFNTVYFTFNRRTVLALWDVCQVAFMSEGKRKLKRKVRRLQRYGVEVHEAYRRAAAELAGQQDADGDDDDAEEAKLEEEVVMRKEPPKAILVKVTATMKCVSLVLNRMGNASAVAVLQNSSVLFQYHESIMDVKGMLGSIVLEDLSPMAHYYPRVISIHGDEMVHLTYRQYNPDFADYPGYKHKLRLRVQSIHFVLLQRFVFELADYFSEMSLLNAQLKEVALDEPSVFNDEEQKEAEAATKRVMERTKREAKKNISSKKMASETFLYEVMIVDLGLLVPKNSVSPEFVQVDMGKISIANSYFEYDDVTELMGQRMSFSMQAANAQTGSAVEPGKLFQIIDDVDFLLEFERPIGDEEHLVPAFKLAADISPIHTRCTEKQYALFRNTISQNLAERTLRANEGPPVHAVPTVQGQDEQLIDRAPASARADDEFDQALAGHRAAEAMVSVGADVAEEGAHVSEDNLLVRLQKSLYSQTWITLALSFNFQKITMELLEEASGEDVAVGGARTFGGDKLVPIARGCMNDFGFAVVNTSDGGSKMDYAFESLTIQDCNKENQFSDLFGHEEDGGHGSFEPQFRYYFIIDPNGKKRMSIILRNPRLVMVPVVYTIVRFFLTPLLSGELPDSIRESIEAERKSKAARGLKKAQRAQAAANAVAAIPSLREDNVTSTPGASYEFFEEINADEQADLLLNVLLIGCVIKLPEDWKNARSKGIIARGGFTLKYCSFGACSSIRAFAEKVRMHSAVLRSEADSTIPIIKPIDLSLSYKTCASECDVEIDIDPLIVTFSYRDFKCLMALAACLTPPSTGVDETDAQAAARQRQEEQSTPVETAAEPAIEQDQSLVVNTGGVQITLLDDLAGHNVALVNFRLVGVYARVDNWSRAMRSVVGFAMQIDYNNKRLALWEPMVELWPCTIKYHRTPIPDVFPVKYNNKASITSDKVLNVNLSKVFFDTMKLCLSSWTEDYLSSTDTDMDSSSVKSILGAPVEKKNADKGEYSIVIHNDTGKDLTYWDESGTAHRVRNGEEAPLLVASARRHNLSNRDIELNQRICTISLRIDGGWERMEHLPVSRVGSWLIALKPKADNALVQVVYAIEYTDGLKVVTVRSNVTLRNASSVPVLARFQVPGRGAVDLSEPILPGETKSVPLQYCNSGQLQLRPAHDTVFGWSDVVLSCGQLDSEKLTVECPDRSVEDADDHEHPSWYFHVAVDRVGEGRLAGRHTIVVSAPFQLENLLAVPMKYSLWSGGYQLAAGEELDRAQQVSLYTVPRKKLLEFSVDLDGFSPSKRENLRNAEHVLKVYDQKKRELQVLAAVQINEVGTRVISFYCKYWMVNKTGLRLLFMQRSGVVSAGGELAAGLADFEQDDVALDDDQANWYKKERTDQLAKPIMYSYTSGDFFGNKTSIKVANSKWSKPISLESVGTDGSLAIEADGRKSHQLYEVGVVIELLGGRFHRTKKITFSPRYVLVNRVQRNLYFRQDSQNAGFLLPAGKSVPYHWPFANKPQELCITFSPKHTWSASFSIGEIAEFAVKISRTSNNTRVQLVEECYLARVEVQLINATFYVIFKPEAVDVPPYRIENMTRWKLFIHQRCKRDQPQTIAPHGSSSFTWDIPNAPHRLQVEVPSLGVTKDFNLDKIKAHPPIVVGSGENEVKLRARIFADGPTRVFRLTNAAHVSIEDEEESLALQMNDSTTAISQYVLELEGAGLSIIDNTPQELIYVSGSGILVDFSTSIHETRLEARLFRFQVDNQLLSASHPVFLSRTPSSPQEADYFHFSMVKSNHYHSIDFYHYFAMRVQEMDIKMDDDIMNRLLSFFNVEFDTEAEFDPFDEKEDTTDLMEPGEGAKKLYFVMFHLNPIKCNLTFTYSNRDQEEQGAATNGLGGDEEAGAFNPVKTVLNAIGVTVANVEDAPISLNTLFLQHAFHTRPEFFSRITKHYYVQLLTEVYKVVLSFDIIGNPASMVHNLGTGVHDFFYEPAQGLVQSPKEFVVGLGKGSTSLAKHSVKSIFGTASAITNSISKGVAHLAMDKEYVRQRERSGREKPRHVGQGFVLGVEELSTGLYQGLTGVWTAPISGARSKGLGGLVKGVGKGMIGAAVKPGVGLFDLATRTTQGIRNTATYFDKDVHRLRAPRGFGPDRVLTAYNLEKAIGQSLLRTIDDGAYVGEWHLFHCVTASDNLLLVSNKQLLCINVRSHQSDWQCTLASIISIEAKGSDVVTQFMRNQNAWAWLAGGRGEQKIEKRVDLTSVDNATWFVARVEKTVAVVSRFDDNEGDLAFSEGIEVL